MTSVPIHTTNGENGFKPEGKKQILLKAFDMSTVGHLSPGQWKVGSLFETFSNEHLFTRSRCFRILPTSQQQSAT